MDNVPLRFNDARALARQTTTLQSVALFAYEGSWPVTLRDDQRFLRLRRSLVSGNYFDVLGAQPVLGRALRPSDDVVGAAPLAVLSYKAWRGSFGGTQAIVGHRLTLEETGVNCAVAGWRAHRYASRAESGGAPDHHPSLVTLDQSLRFQQNLAGRAIAVLEIRARSNRMADLEPLVPEMLRVLPTAPQGQATLVGT